MTNKGKALLTLVVTVIVGLAIYGAYQYPAVSQQGTGSAAGSTFSSAKIASVNMSPLLRAATSTSLLNTDTSARWVESTFVDCSGVSSVFTDLTGAGLAAWTFQAATTSVSSQGLQGNTNYAANMNPIATSTGFSNNATSSTPVLGGYWAAGTYMTFLFNATSTAACTVGVHYLAS